MSATQNILPDKWDRCFDDRWPGFLVPSSLSHPAKFSRGLIKRILQHVRKEGWIDKEGIVLDPFGGIGAGGLMCAQFGYKWIGIELEHHFYLLAQENFDRHTKGGKTLGHHPPKILHGDSRNLLRLLQGRADLIVSGPPIGELVRDTGANEGTGAHGQEGQQGRRIGPCGGGATSSASYGFSRGQMCNMDFGPVDAVISSPPYADVALAQNSEPEPLAIDRLQKLGYSSKEIEHLLSNSMKQDYGSSQGQLARMKAGPLRPVVLASEPPPLEEQTFWEAAHQIVSQCHFILKPRGHAIWNVKDFIRKKKRVHFSGDWLKLCLSCGFRLVCWHRAMLVRQRRVHTLRGVRNKEKDTKSFFKRLHDSKLEAGNPRRVDWEDILCMEKI